MKTRAAQRQRKPSSKLSYDPGAQNDQRRRLSSDKAPETDGHQPKKMKKKMKKKPAPAQNQEAAASTLRLEIITDGHDADVEFDPDAVEESDGSDDEGERHIETLQRAMTMRGAGISAARVLVKWRSLPQEESTWEPRTHLHPEALQDFEWQRELPFALSELLELPPHASVQVLAQEGMLPVPVRALSDEDDEDDEDDEGKDGGEEEEDDAANGGEGDKEEEEDGDDWLFEGHELMGKRVARIFGGKRRGEERVVVGRIVKWVPADAEDEWSETLFHCVHDDGDEEDLDEDEAVEAIAHFRALQAAPTPGARLLSRPLLRRPLHGSPRAR